MKVELTDKECRIIVASIVLCSRVVGSTPEFDDDKRNIIKKLLSEEGKNETTK